MKYPEEQRAIDLGYTFIGWQATTKNSPELAKCYELGHYKDGTVKNKQHTRSGGNCTYWCDVCKHYYKIDMS